MHLSLRAKQLLSAGNIAALQSLSYEELLPAEVRQEILDRFLHPEQAHAFEGSVADIFQDPTFYESLKEPCAISSGHIFSKAAIEALVVSRRERVVNCPMTGVALNINIGGTGLAYVRLPKIDEVVRGYRALRTAPPVPRELLLQSFNTPQEQAVVREDRGTHSAMGALHFTPMPSRNREIVPTAPPLVLAQNIVVGKFEVKVARNKLRIVVVFDDSFGNIFSDQLKSYFERALPDSQVNCSGGSYSMNKECFGRCWKMRGDHCFELDLWFPPQTSAAERETLSDYHLNTLLRQFSKTMGLPQAAATMEEVPACSITAIEPKVYVVAMEAVPASYEQIKNCCQIFLNRTQVIASNLHLPINDTVITHSHITSTSRTSGFRMFGTPNDAAISSSLMSAVASNRK